MIKALDGIELSEDERTLVDMVSNTINSGDKHKIEYANMGDNLSDFGSTIINEGMKGLSLVLLKKMEDCHLLLLQRLEVQELPLKLKMGHILY